MIPHRCTVCQINFFNFNIGNNILQLIIRTHGHQHCLQKATTANINENYNAAHLPGNLNLTGNITLHNCIQALIPGHKTALITGRL